MSDQIEPRPSAGAAAPSSVLSGPPGQTRSGDLGDILERVLDKGIVIAGDIQINLLDIELLTIRLRLIIASVDTAREIGINWWESDPRLSADADGDAAENRQLQERVEKLERQLEHGSDGGDRRLEQENRRLRKRLERMERELEPPEEASEEADG
jgi:gas vesicle protein GvpA/GvpJ/GvpM family